MNENTANQDPDETAATPAATPAAPTPAVVPTADTRIEAESLSVLDAELEELIAKEATVNAAVDILLNAIEHERGVERKDIAEVTLHANGAVRLLTRGRVRRSLRVDPFAPAEATGDSE